MDHIRVYTALGNSGPSLNSNIKQFTSRVIGFALFKTWMVVGGAPSGGRPTNRDKTMNNY